MRCSLLLAAATAFTAVSAVPAGRSTHVLHEKREYEPHTWGKRSRALGHETIPIRIGLVQKNLEHADRYMADVSDPASPNFGKMVSVPAYGFQSHTDN